MAANDFYQQYSQPPRLPAHRPMSSMAFNYNPNPSSTSLDKPQQSQQYFNSKPMSQTPTYEPYTPSSRPTQSDSIPMKQKIRPADQEVPEYRKPAKRSPRSPESNEPRLLPDSKGRKKTEGSFGNYFKGKIPWVVYFVSLVQISVFIAEIIKNSIVTGSPIMIHPQFNPMIGPSTYIQINMGARFVPCMRTTPGVQDVATPPTWPCPNTTTTDPNSPDNHCDLKALCGFSGVDDANPNQWFRFIIPMFLHAGLIHIGFNLLLQLTMGREMEKAIGSIRFAIVYFSSGIFGFVLGGNFAATAIASTGASGCLFGILALVLLDLIYGWNERRHPVKDLMWILVDVLVSFVLGLLPGLDNFSHIGGFLMGLAAGICLLHSPNILRQRIGDVNTLPMKGSALNKSTYRTVGSDADLLRTPSKDPLVAPTRPTPDRRPTTATPANVQAFTSQPSTFFRGRKPLWWAWWLFRLGALITALVVFVVLLNNFYRYRDQCSWCKYLSCLPINHWCDIGNLQLSNATSNSSLNTRGLDDALFLVERALDLL